MMAFVTAITLPGLLLAIPLAIKAAIETRGE